ncbi:sensor histidine kinase KdpD [Actinomadura sp. BRA 177]|uniref:sensor histidine kinase n=1 Tax=Actinomadura sp. BRA 177 TaxID=2745202 RepID=UPI001595ECF0|nr:sensor histidine kinase [Actinomadura sp. BRA 177]NVI89467.1 sensor histidine kinase [Actinomadura sp. BRA 177]
MAVVLGVAAVAALYSGDVATRRTNLVLAALAVGVVLTLGAAVFAADAATRRVDRQQSRVSVRGHEDVQRRLGELWFSIARGRRGLQELVERVGAGETAPRSEDVPATDSSDPFVRLAYELRQAQGEAWNAVLDMAERESAGGTDQRVDVFVNLARRMQSLAHRAIQGLDELENQVEDPDLLKGLFRVDHLSTRMRRQAESLAVIGGAASRRQWSRPVTVYEVLRSAIAEVEHYNRVKVVPPVEGTLDGRAVADVIHLLAELIENATKFAPPHTQVLIRVDAVSAGLAIEVEDRGLGVPRETQRRLNEVLTDPDRAGTGELLQEGRIGLLVVAALARRHGVRVQLQDNLYGGTQAVVIVPTAIVGSEEEEEAEARPQEQPAQAERVPVAVAAAAPPPPSAALSGFGSGDDAGWGPSERDAVPAHAAQHAAPQPTAAGAERRVLPARSGERDPGAGPEESGERPSLPRRRVQANLAPELVNPPEPQQQDDDEIEHDPGLMAAFQRGVRGAEEDDVADGADSAG